MNFGFRPFRFVHHLPITFYQRNHKLKKLFITSDRAMSGKSKEKVFVSRDDFPTKGMKLVKERYDLEIWPLKKGPLPRDELVKQIQVKDALYIVLEDKIDKELLKTAVLLPHIGSATLAARNAMAVLAAQNIIAALDGEEMPAEIKV